MAMRRTVNAEDIGSSPIPTATFDFYPDGCGKIEVANKLYFVKPDTRVTDTGLAAQGSFKCGLRGSWASWLCYNCALKNGWLW